MSYTYRYEQHTHHDPARRTRYNHAVTAHARSPDRAAAVLISFRNTQVANLAAFFVFWRPAYALIPSSARIFQW